MNTITIEYLKDQYLIISNDCATHYKRIQKALLSCKNIDNVREGYNSKWVLSNKLEDFLKDHSIKFYKNYGTETIDCPFNL